MTWELLLGALLLAVLGGFWHSSLAARELANRVLTYEDFRCRCRIFQPPRQRLFARARSGDGQQLEERAAAQEVEVRRVRMGGFEETPGQPVDVSVRG